jgi:Icc-related predicted phosphoesterase
MRVAAVGDLHCTADSAGLMRTLLAGVEREADVLAMAGDLTNMGYPEEMRVLLADLAALKLPKVAVIGNHDHENDHAPELVAMMEEAGVCVLDCTTCAIGGVGFVGTKGFCGGFGSRRIEEFGETTLKAFVRESVREALRLEQALAGMTEERRVAILHYAPIRATLAGESEELFPFLGTSRLADALDRHGVDLVLHGHAHHGRVEGETGGGTPVFNVARFVLHRATGRHYRVFEI